MRKLYSVKMLTWHCNNENVKTFLLSYLLVALHNRKLFLTSLSILCVKLTKRISQISLQVILFTCNNSHRHFLLGDKKAHLFYTRTLNKQFIWHATPKRLEKMPSKKGADICKFPIQYRYDSCSYTLYKIK